MLLAREMVPETEPLGSMDGPTESAFGPRRESVVRPTSPALIDHRYRVVRLLGRGGMGEVYLAHDQRLDRQVALKLVRSTSMTSAARLQARLEREALALARVAHPNVVSIHDVGSHEGHTYVAMQFVPGATLSEWQKGNRSEREVIEVYLQAARGLAAAHSVGVVHRDFKPDNVIVGDDGIVRVLDFGLAAARPPDTPAISETTDGEAIDEPPAHQPDDQSKADSGPSERSCDPTLQDDGEKMTRPGALLGTVAYMSSEQLQGLEADARSDQFAFCVSLWEALAGGRPFSASTVSALLSSMNRPPTNTMRPRWLRGILLRGLERAPEQRWPSLASLIDAIAKRSRLNRKLLVGLGALGTIAAAISLGLAVASPSVEAPPVELCAAFVDDIDSVWNADPREALRAHEAIDPHGTSYAISGLDAVAQNWKSTATALCHDGLAPAVENAERACLQRWLRHFENAVNMLAQRGDKKTLASAPDLLAALVPPNSDYCAAQMVDPEIWQMTMQARALALLGEFEQAAKHSDEAIAKAMANDSREFDDERAFAHAVRAEVAVQARERELAMTEFADAQRYALSATSPPIQIMIWTAWAKLLTEREEPGSIERALGLIAQAEGYLTSMEGGAHDIRQAELLEARGHAEFARDVHHKAIALHREAHALFMAAGQPTLASKSSVNIGRNYQELEQYKLAQKYYAEALVPLDGAHLPPTYRYRIQIERNLGLLAANQSEPHEIAEAIPHFEFVLAYGNEQERFDAHELSLLVALALGDRELIEHWSARLAKAVNEKPDATIDELFRARRAVGFALASLGDARAETMLRAAERASESLSLVNQWELQTDWVEWLEQIERCADARERREHLDIRVARADGELAQQHAAWRAAGPTESCAMDTKPRVDRKN